MSMIVHRTFDMDVVRNIMTHRRVYPHISDDGSLPADQFTPMDNDAIVYLLARDEKAPLGVFMLVPHNTVCYEVHTCMLPRAWGGVAIHAARTGTLWMFNHTKCRRIITNVPAYNTLAHRFAEECGMTQFGVNRKSFLKNGVLYDQLLLGLSKE
jgi:RimJ/RimL family protein N-acetyltransferase